MAVGCLLEWKTTSSRYPEEPPGIVSPRSAAGLLFVDHRNLLKSLRSCFVRKRLVEVQYLHTTITDEQRRRIQPTDSQHDRTDRIRTIPAPTAASAFRRTPAAAVLI